MISSPTSHLTGGVEWIVDAVHCRPGELSNRDHLRELCEQVISDLALKVLGYPHWEVFPDPGGVTGLYLLSESHLACHTYPENGLATFNLYCCRERPEWPWEERLTLSLGASKVRIIRVERGGAS